EPKPTNRYLWGTKQDELICNNNNWTLNDHLNTIRDIVKSDGNVESHLEYNAFGKLISETKNDQLLFAYTGKLFDKSSDLQWNINRWYNSNAGRWVSEDPIKFQSGDKNLYRFLLNMPLWAVDFYGYKPKVTVLPSQECILCNCDCPACCGTVDDLPPLQPKDNPTGLCCKNKQKLYKKFFNGSEAECMRHFSSTTFTNRNINLNVVITSVVVFYSYPFISGVASIGWTLAVYENERYAEILCNTHICDNIIQPYWKFDDDFCEWITACPDNYSYISQLPEIPKSVVEQGVDALFDTLKETNEFLEKSNNVTPGGPWGHPPRY
ncbi:MAG: RHS repeat-associated core domain-containing protein, partial [Planctomycetaceae bacterium]|nr:RHS repeat-associated core domain-containing protein [Planctomycetaceae bacterium]